MSQNGTAAPSVGLDFGSLVLLLQYTLSSDKTQRDGAEQELRKLCDKPGFGIVLLRLCDWQDTGIDNALLTIGDRQALLPIIRMASSIYFKNFVRREWSPPSSWEEGGVASIIGEEEKEQIRLNIVNLMLRADEKIRKQLSDAISLIGQSDFPQKWPKLLPDLAEQLTVAVDDVDNLLDYGTVCGILQTLHVLFKRYRHDQPTRPYMSLQCGLNCLVEHELVVNLVGPLISAVFLRTVQIAFMPSSPATARSSKEYAPIFTTLLLAVKVFFSLLSRVIPQHFDDTLREWHEAFAKILQEQDPSTGNVVDEDHLTVMEKLKSRICQILIMMATKYDGYFRPYAEWFFSPLLTLLSTNRQRYSEPRFDQLSCRAIFFLSRVFRLHLQRQSSPRDFGEGATECCMVELVNKILAPNIERKEADVELFEDNPDEYIRRDIEGSDIVTRRRAAGSLIQSTLQVRANYVKTLLCNYVIEALDSYKRNPVQNWARKDAALWLTTSIDSLNLDVVTFADVHIMPELRSADDNSNARNPRQAIIKCDCIKFLIVFRDRLPNQMVIDIFPHIVKLLQPTNNTLHIYAAYYIENIFTLRTTEPAAAAAASTTAEGDAAAAGGIRLRITPEQLQPFARETLYNLLEILNYAGAPTANATSVTNASVGENDYVMKATMRALSFYRDIIAQFAGDLIVRLATKLQKITATTTCSTLNFTHYLFEPICLCIKLSMRAGGDTLQRVVQQCEQKLLPILQRVMAKDLIEFVPYAFQVIGLALEANKKLSSSLLPARYRAIYADLMRPEWYWEEAYIPLIVRLLEIYFRTASDAARHQQLAPELTSTFINIRQLLETRDLEREGFTLLQAVFDYMPVESLEAFEEPMLRRIIVVMRTNKTPEFNLCFVQYMAFLIHRRGDAHVLSLFAALRVDNLLPLIWQKIVLEHAPRAPAGVQRKLVVVAIGDWLDSELVMKQLVASSNQRLWTLTLRSVLGLLCDAETFKVTTTAFRGSAVSDARNKATLLFWEIRDDGAAEGADPQQQDLNAQHVNQLLHAHRTPHDTADDVNAEDVPRYVMTNVSKISSALGAEQMSLLLVDLDESGKAMLQSVVGYTQMSL